MRYKWILLLTLLLIGCSVKNVENTNPTFPTAVVEDNPSDSLYEKNIKNGVEMEDFQENFDLAYTKWIYKRDSIPHKTNLSNTSTIRPHMGYCLLTSVEDYRHLVSTIDEAIQMDLDMAENYQYDYILVGYGVPEVVVDTTEYVFDETFFNEHNLIVAEYCADGAMYYRSRLDDINIGGSGNDVSITIEHEYPYTSTADCPGVIYWIPVPKQCTEAEVVYILTAWNH